MSDQSIPVLTLSIAANRFVTPVLDQAVAGENTLGVARSAAADGEIISVDVLGTSVVEAVAVIAAGALVQSDVNGSAITKAAGATVGRMAPGQSAGAAGELVEILLISN